MGNFASRFRLRPVQEPTHLLPEELWMRILDFLPLKERVRIRGVSTFFRDAQLSSRSKLAFLNKDHIDWVQDYFEAKLCGFIKFYVNRWSQVAGVVSMAREAKEVAFVYCEFPDPENTRDIKFWLKKIEKLHIYHVAGAPEFLGPDDEDPEYEGLLPNYELRRETRVVLTTNHALMTYTGNLTDFVYDDTTNRSAMLAHLFQIVINDNPNLKRLYIQDTNNYGNLTLQPPNRPSPSLTSLWLRRAEMMTETFLQSIVTSSQASLKQLVISWPIEDVPLDNPNTPDFYTGFKNLTDLRMAGLQRAPRKEHFNFPLLQTLALHSDFITHVEESLDLFTRHRSLRIIFTTFIFNTHLSLTQLSLYCPQLRLLHLYINFELGDEGVACLTSFQLLEELTLRLFQHGNVNDLQMSQVVEGLPLLRCLYYFERGLPLEFHFRTYLAFARKARRNKNQRHFVSLAMVPESWKIDNLCILRGELLAHFRSNFYDAFGEDFFFWDKVPKSDREFLTPY